MAGNGPIGRLPAGLLDFLLLRNIGQNPPDLANFVQPTLDLSRFYAAQDSEVADGVYPAVGGLEAETIYATDLGLTSGDPPSYAMQVPANEIWLCKYYTVQLKFDGELELLNVQQLAPMFYQSGFGDTGPDAFGNSRLIGQSLEAFNSFNKFGAGIPAGRIQAPSMVDFIAPPLSLFGAVFLGLVEFTAPTVVRIEGSVRFIRLRI